LIPVPPVPQGGGVTTDPDGRLDSLNPADGEPVVRLTRVVVVEPQVVLAAAIEAALGEHRDVSIEAVVGSVADAIPLVRKARPDVVVVDTGNVTADDVRSVGDLLDAGVTAALVALATFGPTASDGSWSGTTAGDGAPEDLIRAIRRAARRRPT